MEKHKYFYPARFKWEDNKVLVSFIDFDFAFTLTENEKKKLELAIQEEKVKQYQHFEKYLDEFNTKTQRINDSIVEEEINECFKTSMTNDTTKKQNVISEKVESFLSETLKNMKTF